MAATNISLLSQIFPSQPLACHPLPSRSKALISCTKKNKDADLASDLAKEVGKINSHSVEREEALKKSRQLLFTDICEHLDYEAKDFEKKWKNLSEDDKCDLVKRFVSDWGVNFHPLSTRSVKELVDEHLGFSAVGGIMGISSKK